MMQQETLLMRCFKTTSNLGVVGALHKCNDDETGMFGCRIWNEN